MIAIFTGKSLFDVDGTMDEISGSSLEASVAGLGWKAGTLPGLSNLEVLYIEHVPNTEIILWALLPACCFPLLPRTKG